ncbi:MBL fold metallo-hydrolase RNA specificity domain-containing protein [Saliphagus infecundisoli]|uniref:MBL fold metallo-hydrolase RNA specificity domain-containing protein n=1 Tax=Saliphagus infecundisoli TaxID=1849069 RepID=A0ABD5QA65_9EURY|nr:MBL fold metallo-hydrolase RNA specificity domain-containing protein [Saliphagus infecundisoli]
MVRDGAVSLRDGIRIELSDGKTVVADATEPAGDVAVLSHAHGDHLYSQAPSEVICSELTARLAAARRRDEGKLVRGSHPTIEQVPAGHVPGSSATIIEDEGTTYLYTGDFSPRERFGLAGFDAEAVAADYDVDVLVTETTYGTPDYVFDAQRELERRIVGWLDDQDGPVVLFGYTLGRAQEIERLVARSERERLFVTEAIERLNGVIAEAWGTDFGARRYRRETALNPEDALVLPAQTNKLSFVDRIVEATGAVTAGFSGWAIEESFLYRGGYDETFVLSDHADFSELVATVETLNPRQVYTTHGFADAFATHVETELGIEARSLKENQTSLGEF